jgi:hypothetical protein
MLLETHISDCGEELLGLMMPGQLVNLALYQNQIEFGIAILSVPLRMLLDNNCFLIKSWRPSTDQEQVLWT